jgi:hypothetical protein
MSCTFRRASTVLGVVGLVAVVAGCDKVTGGGWIPSSTGQGKATFGFSAVCKNQEDPIVGPVAALHEGQFEWDDHTAGVSFHGDVEPTLSLNALGTCKEAAQLIDQNINATLLGEYRPQPPGAPGSFEANVTDNGEPGINGDSICVALQGGPHNGYTNCGVIEGGNIQVQ